MNLTQITEDLVRIPSYPQKTEKDEIKGPFSLGEERVARYIEDFLNKYCPQLSIVRQPVFGERYNIIAFDNVPSDSNLMFFCHMDTVNPGKGQIEDGKIVFHCDEKEIHGLGSADMKGGTSALLYALAAMKGKTSGLTLVFYCDEEDKFLGMIEIVKMKNFSSRLAVFCEPTDLEIANGCRGLIEFSGSVEGITAHAARPKDGLNAILLSTDAFGIFEKEVKKYTNQHLGSSDCNLAAINGGILNRDDDDKVKYDEFGKVIILRKGNKVPDFAELLLEVRTANVVLDAKKAVEIYQKIILEKGGNFKLKEIVHDYKPFSNDLKHLFAIEKAVVEAGIPVKHKDASSVGYYDAQMFNERFGIPAICFGPAKNETSHRKDECLTIDSLEKTSLVYSNLLAQIQR